MVKSLVSKSKSFKSAWDKISLNSPPPSPTNTKSKIKTKKNFYFKNNFVVQTIFFK